MSRLRVECAPDARGEPAPARFGAPGALREVVEVCDRWPGEGTTYWRVRTADGARSILRHDERADRWEIWFFQSPDAPGIR